ncbi:hypothetical protein VaNZ11_003663 [Volvox africanus]|uniref:Protein kinase domain-containing protein n=1 Tax=Volvox africanus TaxID=51714 RepID=A0ABQ5RVR4_9CHLO|nr:hypothetical protein VaNZ11_003663 [Volvox africanus]
MLQRSTNISKHLVKEVTDMFGYVVTGSGTAWSRSRSSRMRTRTRSRDVLKRTLTEGPVNIGGLAEIKKAYHLAMREIKLLRATSNEHVVSVIEAFRSQSSGNVYLVMEYAESCLNLELKKHRTGLPTSDVMRITWQLASALQYLHSRKIVHRDLKPANILLTAAGDLKLCDFGFARDLPPAGQQADMSSYVTTRWYRAPEVVVGAEYGAAVDIWALGCLFAELLNGQPLFPGASNMDQLALIVACFGHLPNRLLAKALTNPQLVGVQLRTGNPRNWAVALQQRFAPYGENAVTLLLSCLNPDPLKRATADEVLRSAYFEPIRQKKVPSLNGHPSIAITVTTSAPASMMPAPAPLPVPSSVTQSGPLHPAAIITAATVATAAADGDTTVAPIASAAANAKPTKDAPQSHLQQQQQLAPQQQRSNVVGTVSDSTRPSLKEVESQPERPVPPVTVHAAPAVPFLGNGRVEGPGPVAAAACALPPAPVASAASEGYAKQGPSHPALAVVSRQTPAAEPSVKDGEQDGSTTGSGAGMEVDTPPAAPAQSNVAMAQRQTTQVRFLPQTLPSVGHGQNQNQSQGQSYSQVGEQAGAVVAASMRPSVAVLAVTAGAAGAVQEVGGNEVAKQHQKDARPPANFAHMRASMATIPMLSGSMGARPMTDTGMGVQGMMQVAQGKAGSTLIQHNKRASEHSIGVYGNHRGSGAASGGPSDMPMRLARVSLVNPNIDVMQLAAENASASSSPSTTPTGTAAATTAAVAAATTEAAPGNSIPIPPASNTANGTVSALASSLGSGGGAATYGAATGRRRSTATGSRLTRVSHTCEGQDQQLRDDDSEEDRSNERLSLNGGQGASAPGSINPVGSLAAVGMVLGSGLHPSPRRRHSRLASVTEPGGQHPPGAIAAAGIAAAAAGNSSSTLAPGDGSGYDHVSAAASRGPSAPQMLSPLGRSTHQLGHHHGANAISAGLGPGPTPNPGHVVLVSDSGHHAVHSQLHSTMSAISLNAYGVGAAGPRERERDREALIETSGMLRSNAVVGIATPAAPTASQRSFTSQAASTSAAAAGLMSRPVSNLYINLEQHGISSNNSTRVGPQESGESHSTDSSAAVSPSTPTGSNGGAGGSAAIAPGVAASAAVAAVAAAPAGRRTTFTDGPSSMFKSVLRTLSNRRPNTNSHPGTVAEQQAASATAAPAVAAAQAPPGLHPTNSIGGAPPVASHGSVSSAYGAVHSQSSASSGGVSPFIPSRASSHNFITGAPPERVPGDVTSSLSVPGITEDYSTSTAAAAALRRSATVTHGASVGLGIGGNARIGLPHLNVRIPEAAGSGPAAVANGYGSAVVSPASRRRSQLAAQPARTSDVGMVMTSTGLRQTSTGSMGIVPGLQGCKATTSLHGEIVAVPGLVGGGGAALPVVRNPAPPAEAPPTRLAPGKGGRDVS